MLVPSSNTVMEVDFYRNLPQNMTVHVSRMYLTETTVQGESEMLDVYFPKALYDLATLKPHVIVFGCTSAGALRGNDYDEQLCKKIEEIGKCASVSIIKSARLGIQKLGLKKLAIITPYIDDLNKRIKKSFEDDGVEVVSINGFGIDVNFELASPTPEEILRFAKERLAGTKADGVFISCTNFRSMEIYKQLQKELGIPVLTSNQVSIEETIAKAKSLTV